MKKDILKQYLISAFTNKSVWNSLRNPSWRGSELPICSIKWILTKIINLTAETPILNHEENIYSDFFLNEGSFIHELLQKYMGASKILYGNWVCTAPIGIPDKKGRQKLCMKSIGPQLGSEMCHGRWMKYQEKEIKDPITGIVVHIDAIIHLPLLRILGDFKTSKSAWNEGYVMPENYYHQINCYWWVCRNIKISFNAAAIIYIPRDYFCCNPKNWLTVPIKPDYEKWIQNYKDMKKAEKCFKTYDFDLFKKCVKQDLCEYDKENNCMFAPICHPQAGIGRWSHYKEIWEPFTSK